LVEEIARVYGYDRLPIRLPAIAGGHTVEEEAQLNSRVLADTLSGRGYREVITYSFVDPSIQAVLEPSVAPLLLANPLSRDLSAMRTTLWAGLLPTAQRNINRQVSRLRLFEQGLRFLPGATIEALQQEPMIAGLLYGNAAPRHFSAAPRGVDFYDIKADVEALLALGGAAQEYSFVAAEHPVLHPGQTAQVLRNGEPVGWLGRLHPGVAKQLHVAADIYLFELKAHVVQQGKAPMFSPLSDQPAVRRDLALVLADAVPAATLMAAIRAAAGSALMRTEILDVYQGDSLGEGKKSIAVGLTFQDPSRTLKESDINQLIDAILARVKTDAGAALRE